MRPQCVATVVGSGGNGGVDDIVAKGPQGVLKPYFLLEWLNRPMYGGGGYVGVNVRC